MTYPASYWREAFPEIDWDEPVKITVMNPGHEANVVYGCRICIANHGLKGTDISKVARADLGAFARPDEFIEHLQTVHAS